MRLTLEYVTQYANKLGINVEKTGREYEAWRQKDHSTVSVSYTLAECLRDVNDMAYIDRKNALYSPDLIGSQATD